MNCFKIALLGLALAAATSGAVVLDGDAVAGRQVYERCMGCHSPQYDRTGPRHCGLFGRVAGSVDGFAYSAAMQQSDVVWDRGTLDQFLESPLTFMPGTAMGIVGIKDASERSNLLAYLEELSASSQYCRSAQ